MSCGAFEPLSISTAGFVGSFVIWAAASKPSHDGHADIQQDDVRLEAFGERERLTPVGGATHDLERGRAAQNGLERLGEQAVVVRDHQGDSPWLGYCDG